MTIIEIRDEGDARTRLRDFMGSKAKKRLLTSSLWDCCAVSKDIQASKRD